MDIKISHNWLKEYLDTKAAPKQIGDDLALCGPSVERTTKVGNDFVYDIEITTNRVDCMSIMGVAREANAILPEFGIKAKLKETNYNFKNNKKEDLLNIKIDPKLTKRVMAICLEVENGKTPKWMKDRLEKSGMRSLNSVVDITNYVMQEIGHPTHVFDYDAVASFAHDKIPSLVFRLSKKNEEIITFDGKLYKLFGDDIIIDNGKGEIIDLPGIIGLKNSVVNKDSKRIIFFINNDDPLKIRKTSTRLGIRTNAAILNEKGVDPELAKIALIRGIELFEKVCKARIISKTYDIYPSPFRPNTIKVEHQFIEKIIGIKIDSKKVISILQRLGFTVSVYKKLIYFIKVPSFRANDVTIPEDIVEEVARIYGYQNLPSKIMSGDLPEMFVNTSFDFENKIKNTLKGYGGMETYTLSLVPKELADKNALSLKNPLGEDTKYLRTNLKNSLIQAMKENIGEKEPFYIFEIANVYIPCKDDLPHEVMTLGIMFANYSYRKAKGIIEALLMELNISIDPKIEIIEDRYFYFEYEVEKLKEIAKSHKTYIPIPKYPPQIEDLTFIVPEKTKIGELIRNVKSIENISDFQLIDIFKDSYTFRIWYQDINKTLNDSEVIKIRNKIIKEAQNLGLVLE